LFKDRSVGTAYGMKVAGTRVSQEPVRRQSPGLDQFFSSLAGDEGVSILDLAGASQANITFITGLGHRIYSDDIVRTLDTAFGDGDFFANQADQARVHQFMSGTLDFPERHFGGALVWDTLQFLTQPLLQQTVDQLFHILQPGASMLAYFHADEKARTIPVSGYRIVDSKTVLLTPRAEQRPAQFFNNRALEKLFHSFASVKFFLTRDHLREVIVKR
jgi:hypothetical protein